MHLPQSQNDNLNNMCIDGDPACIISKEGGAKSRPEQIMCHVDGLFPYHVTGACVKTNPRLSFTWQVIYLN
jgi:hypothetical protein